MTTDYGGGRTHDEAFFERIERGWGYSDREQERMDREDAMVANYDPADHARGVDEPQSDGDNDCCRICGEPVQFSGRRFMHVLPALTRLSGEPGSPQYTAEQVAQGFDIYSHIQKVGDHEAAL